MLARSASVAAAAALLAVLMPAASATAKPVQGGSSKQVTTGVVKRAVNLDVGAVNYRFHEGLDCDLAPGDTWEWGRMNGELFGGRYWASITGSAQSVDAKATWQILGAAASPYSNGSAETGSRDIKILGVNLQQVYSETWTPAGPTVTENRVPKGQRPAGWITCNFIGQWFEWEAEAADWLNRSVADSWWFSGGRAATWTGTVDVYVKGGIPVTPPLTVPEGHPWGADLD